MISLKIDDNLLRRLNESDNQILKYIYGRGTDICNMSVQQFAAEVSCAPSSVIRFCRKIGFSGFSELKYALGKSDSPKEKEVITDGNLSFETILSDITTDIRGTANLLENDDIYRIANLLLSDIPLYLYYPSGITDSLIRYLEKLLMIASLHNLITVGITPYTNNPVAANCRYNLRFFTHPKENQGTEYTSRLCIFYTIDTLIAFYRMLKRGDELDE